MSKILIGTDIGSYTFNKVAKTITFAGFTPRLDRFLVITDVATNTIIYNFADPTKGGSVNGQVLTLDWNTNTVDYANGDPLQIWYYDENYAAHAMMDIAMSVKRDLMLARTRDPMENPALGRTVNLPNTQAIASLTLLTQLQQFGSGNGYYMGELVLHSQMRSNFNTFKNNIIT